jgi:sporulation protein YlmC with PRC-barrel domain
LEVDVQLIRDLLDKPVVDRNGREMGRVDSIMLERRDNAPARVTAIEIGPAVLARRLSPILGRWAAGVEHAFGVDDGRPFRIHANAVIAFGDNVKIDVAVGETSTINIEQTLRKVVAKLPGAKR